MRRIGYLAVIVTVAGCGGSTTHGSARPSQTSPRSAHARDRGLAFLADDREYNNPGMGVACGRANYIPCNRVGLSIRFRQPAKRVMASVGKQRFAMKMGGFGGSGPKYWEGYTTRPGLTSAGPFRIRPDRGAHYWAGRHPLTVRVSIVAVFNDGHTERGTLPVDVGAGWG